MIPTLQVIVDPSDISQFEAYYDAVGKKLAREQMIPILKSFLDPMVASEKAFLAGHTESGALAGSLSARAGSGDRPGTISVFAAATATTKQLQATWGKSTPQKRGYVARIKKKTGRRSVFYADFVEKGHRIVKVKHGTAYVAGQAKPVPFASQAVDAMGDEQANAAAEAVLDYILGD